MDVEGPLTKAFRLFVYLFSGVAFLVATVGLIIATRGMLLVILLVFLLIFLVYFYLENKQDIFKKFKRGEK
ncbi:hypothetical protein AM24_022 [Acinetobacter phage AM24]|nr:hypothetical protein AM24_022 [Acinetobacter phage AM24]